MKQKINKNKTKTVKRTKSPFSKKYPTEYLAVAISLVLLIEGMAIGSTLRIHWDQAFRVLDVSVAVSETVSDMHAVFSPMANTVENVNTFYSMATDEMTTLLDVSNEYTEVSEVYFGISEFYNQATSEMSVLLDASSIGEISGVWIGN